MDMWGRVVRIDGNLITFASENAEELANLSLITQADRPEAVLEIPDQRRVSNLQRKKAYAVMRDIANWSGHEPTEIKEQLKFDFEEETGIENVSLGKSDMTTVRYFITFLLEVCFKFGIPLSHKGLAVQDDLEAYLYLCLRYRHCALCGKHADVHHVDVVGMGQDRNLVDHRDKRLIALCREHHQEAHNMGWAGFKQLHHVIGIKLDKQTLNQLGIMTYKQMEEWDYEYSKSNRTTN